MKPLLLGESPSPAEGPDAWMRPLSGRVAATLCNLAGLSPTLYDTLRDNFECRNLVPRAEAAAQLPSSWWSSLEARTRFEQVWELSTSSCVVCLGRKVATAAGMKQVEWGEWVDRMGAFGSARPVVTIPHPSGLNRLYNLDTNRELASRVLRRALRPSEHWRSRS